jgi:dTMP kinase
MPGLFITFEGIDLCGKSTQAQLLVTSLRERKIEVVLSREPGGPPISEKIRQILLSREHGAMKPLTELLLYEAGRAQHTGELIRPSLEAGRCVVLDRYSDASTAYQGWGRQLGADLVKRLNELATGGLRPDITLLLDLPPEEAARRAAGKNWQADRLEGEAIEFHRRVREGYRQLATEEPDRVKLIDGRRSIDDIHNQILALIEPLLISHFPQYDTDGRSSC